MRGTALERFFAKVIPEPNSGCWLWLGAYHRQGYGQFSVSGSKVILAHRASWYLHYGEMPDPSIRVCHRCDTPSCVNPEHLWLGTQGDNVRDAFAKKRMIREGRRGITNSQAVLTEAQVIEIRQSDGSNRELADHYGVVSGAIHNVRSGLTWGWLK